MLLKLWPIIRFQLDQFLDESSIFVDLIDCILQQRRSCFLPSWSLLFSLFPGRIHSSCVSPQVFLFLFCKHCKILPKPDNLVGSLHIPSGNFSPCGPGPFHHSWHMSFVLFRLPCGVHIFSFRSTYGVLVRASQPSQDNSQFSPLWKYGAG